MKQLTDIVPNVTSYSQVLRELGWPLNGTYQTKVRLEIQRLGLNTNHFISTGGSYTRKRKRLNKVCPVCAEPFVTIEGKKEKTTCSKSCSNTFFRSSLDNPNYIHGNHRAICFGTFPKQCLVCGWTEIVEVHHLDKNNKNNDISNLVPLCPNHHKAIHSRKYFEETKEKIQRSLAQLGRANPLGG